MTGTPTETEVLGAYSRKHKLVYPNPADDSVHFEAPVAAGNVAVYTLGGSLVLSSEFEGGGTQSVRVDSLAAGVYILVVSTSDVALITERIVVR